MRGIQTTGFGLLSPCGIQHINVGIFTKHLVRNLVKLFCTQRFCKKVLFGFGWVLSSPDDIHMVTEIGVIHMFTIVCIK